MDTVPPSLGVCSVCQKTTPRNQLVEITQLLVCADCKPQLLQRLQEGLPPTTGLWRKKKEAVAISGTVFPARCIKCNTPTDDIKIRRSLSWHPQLYFLLVLCNLLIYAVVALIVRKKSVVFVAVCQEHRKKRAMAILIGWLLFLGGMGAIIYAANLNEGLWALIGVTSAIAGAILGITKGRLLYATFIDKNQTRIGGLGREFLDSLPEWQD